MISIEWLLKFLLYSFFTKTYKGGGFKKTKKHFYMIFDFKYLRKKKFFFVFYCMCEWEADGNKVKGDLMKFVKSIYLFLKKL